MENLGLRNKQTHFGLYMNEDTLNYYKLYAIHKGVTKTDIMREMIEHEKDRLINEEKLTKEVLIDKIVDQIYTDAENSDLPYEEFVSTISSFLAKRKLSKYYIEIIQTKFEQKWLKENKKR